MNPESATLITALRCQRSPISAKRLIAAIYYARSEKWTERKVRAVASALDGRVISGPGMNGYILKEHATDEQRREAAARLRSQAKRMNEKAAQIESR